MDLFDRIIVFLAFMLGVFSFLGIMLLAHEVGKLKEATEPIGRATCHKNIQLTRPSWTSVCLDCGENLTTKHSRTSPNGPH